MNVILFALRNASAAFFILGVSCLTLFAQGPLPPPGAPGPTMKTLDQIDTHVAQVGETRIPIDTVHTPGDASNLFIINKPGSYYLTANITGASGKRGILILAGNVTVDLNGYALFGVPGALDGILAPANFDNLRIHNGSVQNWGSSGITANVFASQFDHLRVSGNSGPGLTGCTASVLSDITAEKNSIGITIGLGCALTRCAAFNNQYVGIQTASSSILTHCAVLENGSEGISAGDFCTIRDCTAQSNATDGIRAGQSCIVTNCASTKNGSGTTGAGILTDIRASVSGCTAIGNKGDGIVFSGDSVVLNNHASTNGGAGFHDLGSASRIEGNVARENIGLGISAATIDTVIRNNSGANGNGAANNQYGPTAGANWGPVGTANNATSPWANF